MKGESLKTRAFRHGINLYPMFVGTGGKATYIQSDWHRATVRLKLGILTRNYVGTIFGGSMFSAMDPFHMILLINILGKEYVVWDKGATIAFKKPGRGQLTMDIVYTDDEIAEIREQAKKNGKYEFNKPAKWIDEKGDVVSTVTKTLYVATKEYRRMKERAKLSALSESPDPNSEARDPAGKP